MRASGVPEKSLADVLNAYPALRMIESYSELEVDRPAQDGDTLDMGGLSPQAIWTPGHSPGHICLYEPRMGVIFSGDHALLSYKIVFNAVTHHPIPDITPRATRFHHEHRRTVG